MDAAELVERIWARDASLWTGSGEDQWLGWLDEPARMQERLPEILAFAEEAREAFDATVLLGMGGSSLAPELLRLASGADGFHVLDTTHPAAVRRLAESLDPGRTLFLVSSKSGTTLETRSHLDFFWELTGGRGESFAAITDPGSELETLAGERGFRAVFPGEPTIGGRYSALSPFGVVPAALMGAGAEKLLADAVAMAERCRSPESPGVDLGLRLAAAWQQGHDKVVFANPHGFGLWLEQLLAESTGKQGKGLVPAPENDPDGPDRQAAEVDLDAGLGAELYRWEVAVAAAGAVLGINPFDQPNVQEAKDRTLDVLSGHGQVPGTGTGLEGTMEAVEGLLAGAAPPEYVAIQAFIDPEREGELAPLVARARATDCAVTVGLGPRYLHSTGQLHKGGPPMGRFVQVTDDAGDELPIPGREFGFRRLVHAQAEGDFAALAERGRPIVRVRLEDL